MVTCFILTVLVQIVFRLFSCVLDEGDYVTFGYCCRKSVCGFTAPYSVGENFRQYFFALWYLSHPLTSVQNFTDIVLGKVLLASSVFVASCHTIPENVFKASMQLLQIVTATSQQISPCPVQGSARNFHLGAITQGSRGGAPVGGWRTKSPEAKSVCRHCLQILTAETIKI